MSKRLILILTLAFVVGISFAAYAEVQNVKVSGDLYFRGVGRNSFQTDDTAEAERALIGAVRLRIDADLTDNVSTTVRLLNEREWQGDLTGTAGDINVDIDLAYATLKDFMNAPIINAPITFVIGRQDLRYGNGFIIGDPKTAVTNLPATLNDLSVKRSFDALKAIMVYDPLTLDLVYAIIEEGTTTRADDVKLTGVNASYIVNSDLMTEGYWWQRVREFGSTGMPTGTGITLEERLNTLGARAVYTGIDNLTLGLEGAWQFGSHAHSTTLYPNETQRTWRTKVDAYALQFTSNYMFPDVTYTPSVAFNYTRLSGDKDQSLSDNYHGWDPMFEDQAVGTIFNKIAGYSNCSLINLGGTIRPMDDVTVKLDWYNLQLLQPFKEIPANANGTALRILSGVLGDAATWVRVEKKHLADEIDLTIMYDYTEDVQLGLCGGIYIPGSVYDKVNRKNASQIIGSMKVTF